MAHRYIITLTPIRHSSHGLDAVQFTARGEDQAEKRWSLSPYVLASLLAERFALEEIVSIEGRLHRMQSAMLPGEYSAFELAEMGYRLTKDVG